MTVERLRLREAAGLSRAQVTAAVGVGRQTVANWESGETGPQPPGRGKHLKLLEGPRRDPPGLQPRGRWTAHPRRTAYPAAVTPNGRKTCHRPPHRPGRTSHPCGTSRTASTSATQLKTLDLPRQPGPPAATVKARDGAGRRATFTLYRTAESTPTTATAAQPGAARRRSTPEARVCADCDARPDCAPSTSDTHGPPLGSGGVGRPRVLRPGRAGDPRISRFLVDRGVRRHDEAALAVAAAAPSSALLLPLSDPREAATSGSSGASA